MWMSHIGRLVSSAMSANCVGTACHHRKADTDHGGDRDSSGSAAGERLPKQHRSEDRQHDGYA